MRARLAAAVLAALAFAVPAAAQPDPVQILTGAFEQMVRNHEGVRDYTLLLTSGADSTWVYVYQEDGEWQVAKPDGPLMSQLLSAAVVWPRLNNRDELGIDLEDAEGTTYLRSETLDGRTAHVLSFGETDEDVDSSLVYVDTQTRQVLRMHIAGTAEEGPGGLPMQGPQRIAATIAMSDYRETDGLTIPRRVRFGIRLDLSDVSAEEQAEMQAELDELREEMKGEDAEEFGEFLEMIEFFGRLLVEGGFELDTTISQVRVNSGPPEWFEGSTDEDDSDDDEDSDDEDEEDEDPDGSMR